MKLHTLKRIIALSLACDDHANSACAGVSVTTAETRTTLAATDRSILVEEVVEDTGFNGVVPLSAIPRLKPWLKSLPKDAEEVEVLALDGSIRLTYGQNTLQMPLMPHVFPRYTNAFSALPPTSIPHIGLNPSLFARLDKIWSCPVRVRFCRGMEITPIDHDDAFVSRRALIMPYTLPE